MYTKEQKNIYNISLYKKNHIYSKSELVIQVYLSFRNNYVSLLSIINGTLMAILQDDFLIEEAKVGDLHLI